MGKEIARFTSEEVESLWPYYKDYLVDILNNEYSIEEAREDLDSLRPKAANNRGE